MVMAVQPISLHSLFHSLAGKNYDDLLAQPSLTTAIVQDGDYSLPKTHSKHVYLGSAQNPVE